MGPFMTKELQVGGQADSATCTNNAFDTFTDDDL